MFNVDLKNNGNRLCVNQDCWLLEYPWQLEKNKDWSGGVMEYWSGGKE